MGDLLKKSFVIVASWFLFWFSINSFAPAPATKLENFFETAQLASVSVESPGGSFGSGFVLKKTNPAGETRLFLWTAEHVIEEHTEVTAWVIFSDGQHKKIDRVGFGAQLVARFVDSDSAVLLLNAKPELFTKIVFDEQFPELGDAIFVIGTPFGEHENAVVSGIISQFNFEFSEKIDGWSVIDQTTAPLNPGNSGGPVFSKHGVIGIAVGTERNGINYYVPTRAILQVAESAGFGWVVSGDFCPADAEINFAIDQRRYE